MNPSAPTPSDDAEPKPWHKGLVALLAVAFFLTPYLFSSRAQETDALGAELVGDGLVLATQHPALRAAQEDAGALAGTLTTSWWGDITGGQALYRPVPSFLLGLAGAAGGPYQEAAPGDRTFPYHAIALALNVLCALLVLEVAWLIFRNAKAALVSGAVFATLPIHGEVLFDVAGLAELSAAAFSLAAWAAWLRAGDQPFKQPAQLGLSLLFLFLATLSKESAFALPLVFFLFDLGRAKDANSLGGGVSHALSKVPALAACAAVLAVSLGIRYLVLGKLTPDYVPSHELDNPLLAVGFLDRAMNALRVMASGVAAIFGVNTLSANWNYSPDYSAHQVPVLGAFALWNLVGLVAVVGSLVLAAAFYTRCKTRSALVFALFGALLLTSNLVFPIGTLYGDRLMFFPSAIAVLFLAAFLARMGQVGVVAGLLLALGGGYWTWTNGKNHWSDQTDLWTYAAERSAPNSARAHFNNGVDAANDQVFQIARNSFERAIEIFPGYAQAHAYLGNLYTLPQQQDLDKAIEHFERAIVAQLEDFDYDYPREPEVGAESFGPRALLFRLNRLRLFEESTRDPEAQLAFLDSLIAKGYDSAYVHHRRANALAVLGRMEEAEAAFERSVSIEPTRDAVQAYGEYLLDTGRSQEALTLYRSVSEFDNPVDHVQFLLQRAEAEFVDGPEAVLATADELWKLRDELSFEGLYQFTPEEEFRTLYLRAQAKSLLYGANPSKEQLEELVRILRNAVGAWKAVNSETYEASALLSQYLIAMGDDESARVVLEALLLQRDPPSLRYQLGNIYARQGRLADALDQFSRIDENLSLAVEANPGDQDFLRVLVSTRATVLEILRALEREDEVPSVIGQWHERAQGEYDPVALYVHAYWTLSSGDVDAAFDIADLLQQEFPEDQLGQGLVADLLKLKELEERAAGSDDPAVLEELAALRRRLKNTDGALELAKRVVELSGEAPPRDQARRLSLLAACYEASGDLRGALDANRRALELELSDADEAVVLAEIERLEGLLTE